MEVEQFASTRLKAIELFKSQPKGGKDIVSLDAIFISLCTLASGILVIKVVNGRVCMYMS